MIKTLCWQQIILIDIGPKAGYHGGKIVAEGDPRISAVRYIDLG
jgi:excinuclease UvrABC ATPase subunit